MPREPPHEGGHPSVLALSDTLYASSDLTPAASSVPAPPAFAQDRLVQPRVVSLPSSTRTTRSQSSASTATIPGSSSTGPIKRKPLSSAASPLAVRYSAPKDQLMLVNDLPKPESRFSRSFSVDSPTLYEFPGRSGGPSRDGVVSLKSLVGEEEGKLEEEEEEEPPSDARSWSESVGLGVTAGGSDARNTPSANPAAPQTLPTPAQSPPQHERQPPADVAHLTTLPDLPAGQDRQAPAAAAGHEAPSSRNSNSSNMSLFVRKPSPPHLSLEKVDTSVQSEPSAGSDRTDSPSLNKPLPKSPPKSPSSSKLGTFFGWGGSAPSPSTATEFSVGGYSPLPSPYSTKQAVFTDDAPLSPQGLTPKASTQDDNPLDYVESYLLTPAATPSPSVQIEEMEDELRAISAELASSIRREMDLEDLVDRLQAEISNPQASAKRTSDYFSDSGYSSAKFGEYDASKEEVAQLQRRAEQEKAQVRLELTGKLNDERSKRRVLDQQIKELAEKASQADASQMNSKDADTRVKELEKTCDDLRRRLADERQVKDNFEDLLSALKGELQSAANERDNLRDEIVPQLRARVEGLEAQAAEGEKLAYETSKMQQELQELKTENTSLKNAQPADDRVARLRSSSVTQQPFKLQQAPAGLTRSNTVKAGSGGLTRSNTVKATSGGLTRSNTVKATSGGLTRSNTVKTTETREALSDRLKDVEAQRDALHSALKSLLERQEFQNRENEKKVRVLEVERDRLMASSPKRLGYQKEVANLREEINVLRRRAEEAIEQKWQVENGLIGLKSDLDRAEEEIASLRTLLREKDILIPASFARSSARSSTGDLSVPVTSESLERAYRELQESYLEALERIKELEIGGTASASQDERTKLAMERLEQSLSAALHERDDARQEADSHRARLESLEESEKAHLENERDLADQLGESASRVEELAQQVCAQLATNATLRARLSETVARGEVEQRINKQRITNMQDRMRSLEEQIIAAQSAAEDRLARHEDEVKNLKDAHNAQLLRLRDASGGLKSPRAFPPKSPLSPLFSPNAMRSPRLIPARAGTPNNEAEREEQLAQIETLQFRVQELERALSAADAEMQEVVGRMNMAQIEVLGLQEEREAAVRDTRRLQRLLEAEKVKSFEERFGTINGMVKA